LDYAAEVGKHFLAEATSVASPEGEAWTGRLSMVETIEDLVDEAESDEIDIMDFCYDAGNTESLVDFAVRNSGPPDWDWALRGIRVDDHGFIVMTHEDALGDPGLPIFASWTPYDNQFAFEAALAAGLRAYLGDFIGVGTHCTLYGRVTPDLWSRTIATALEAWEGWRPQVEEMDVTYQRER